jgi:hypothetical protein
MASKVHIEPADNDWHGRICAHRHEEQRSVLDRAIVMDSQQDSKSGYAYEDGEEGKQEAVLQAVTEPGYCHGEPEGSSPRRNAVELCLDWTVSKVPNNARRKVGVSVGRHDQPKVHEAADNDLDVLEHVAYVGKRNGPFPARGSLINLQAGFDKCAFVLAKPLGFLREVGQQKEEEERDKDCQKAF